MRLTNHVFFLHFRPWKDPLKKSKDIKYKHGTQTFYKYIQNPLPDRFRNSLNMVELKIHANVRVFKRVHFYLPIHSRYIHQRYYYTCTVK